MKLTTHFSLEEMTISQEAARSGIDNTAPAHIVEKLRKTCQGLEAARVTLGCAPIIVSSGYRCPKLNRKLGSKEDSQHIKGEAADFVFPGFGSPSVVFHALQESEVEYDQLILEFGRWVHISFSDHPRRQSLVIDADGAKAA